MRMLPLLLALLAGCPGSLANYNYAAEPDPRGQELVLGVGDVVQINVWEQRDLNTEGKIRPDGTITMPLVGDLKAAGQTPTELKAQIREHLGQYIKLGAGTEITVAVRSWSSYKFTVEGEVTRQGVLSSDQYVRVSDALASGKRQDMNIFVLPGDQIYVP